MPRDITYTKYIETSPHEGHLTTHTQVVESVVTVPIKVYCDSAALSGFRGDTLNFNVQIDTRSYTNPVNLRIGTGLRPSEFNTLVAYNNVTLTNGNFPVSMFIPFNLPLGTSYLWYEVEPVADAFKSKRSEPLTFSLINNTIRTLTVASNTMDLTLSSNVSSTFTIYVNGAYHSATTGTTITKSLQSGVGANIRVVISAPGYISQEETFFMNTNLSRSYNLIAKPTWTTQIIGLTGFTMSATETVSPYQFFDVRTGSDLAFSPDIIITATDSGLSVSYDIVNVITDAQGAEVRTFRYQVTRSNANSLKTTDTPFNIKVIAYPKNGPTPITSEQVSCLAKAQTVPAWPSSIITPFPATLVIDNVSNDVTFSITIELGSDYGGGQNYMPSTSVERISGSGTLNVSGVNGVYQVVNGRTRLTNTYKASRADINVAGVFDYRFVLKNKDGSNTGPTTTTRITVDKHINAVTNVRKFYNYSGTKFVWFEQNVQQTGNITMKSEIFPNMVPGSLSSLPAIYTTRNLDTKLHAANLYRVGLASHIVKFDPIQTGGQRLAAVNLHIKLGTVTAGEDLRTAYAGTANEHQISLMVRKLLQSNTYPATFNGSPSVSNLISGVPYYFLPDVRAYSNGIFTVPLNMNMISNAELEAGFIVEVTIGNSGRVSEINTSAEAYARMNTATQLGMMGFWKFGIAIDYTDRSMYELEVKF